VSSTGPSGFQVAADAARYYDQHVSRFMRPFVEALAGMVSPGCAVLDVACGTGFVARAAAQRVGSTGRVAAIDLNPAMIAVARSVPVEAETPIEWREGSALDLPWDDATFDLVVAQQGVQFFPDPSAGLAEMRRVARPGGRVAAAVWAPLDQSPYHWAMMETLAEMGIVERAVIDQALPAGGEVQVRSWFRDAELAAVNCELVEAVVSLPPPADYCPAHLRALPWSAGFFALDEARQQDALDQMCERLRPWVTEDGAVRAPFRSFLLTAEV
jgi:SAM-dependent methyltransferase